MANYALSIPSPQFDTQIVEDIVELEKLKARSLHGSTHPAIFFSIKAVFHLLESFQSARIEGNHTTIDELVEASIDKEMNTTESLREIANLDDAMTFLEGEFDLYPSRPIDDGLIKELHRLTVKNLRSPHEGGEGDDSPGSYRSRPISIEGSTHKPPPSSEIHSLMAELVAFINDRQNSRTDLLRIAMAHHRFVYIHPFRNGNGRTVRLLTYAMLLRAGFRVGSGRILNPTAVFCKDRSAYMQSLSNADSGEIDHLLAWCEFVLSGLRSEIVKVDALLDTNHLRSVLLLPTIALAQERNIVSTDEARVLTSILDAQLADVSVFKKFYPNKSPASLSHVITKFKNRKLISPFPSPSSRKYVLELVHGPLLRPLIESLRKAGFIHES